MSYPTIVIPPRKTSASNLSNDPEIWKAALASPFTHALVGEMIPERSTSYRRRKQGDPATTAPLTPQTPTAFDSLAGNLDHCHNLSLMPPSESYPKTLTNVHLIPPPSPLSYPTICERISSRMKSGGGSAEIASTAAGMKSTTTQQEQQQHVSINKAIQEFQRIQHSSNEAASAISPTAYHSNSNQDQAEYSTTTSQNSQVLSISDVLADYSEYPLSLSFVSVSQNPSPSPPSRESCHRRISTGGSTSLNEDSKSVCSEKRITPVTLKRSASLDGNPWSESLRRAWRVVG